MYEVEVVGEAAAAPSAYLWKGLIIYHKYGHNFRLLLFPPGHQYNNSSPSGYTLMKQPTLSLKPKMLVNTKPLSPVLI